jgi:ABC-2 type transport system permease protein
MLRYFRLALALFRYSLTRELMFKANFLIWIAVEFAWFAIQLVLIEVIYSHVPLVAGWTKYEMLVLVGSSLLVQQVFQFVFMINCIELPENVRTGKLDFALLQPANSQFLVSVRKFDLGAIFTGSFGLGVVIYAANQLGLDPSAFQLLLFVMLILNGALIHYALMLVIVTLSFWIVRAQGLVYGYYNLFQITRIPQEAFKGTAVRLLFTYMLPMLVVANFPAKVIVRGLTGMDVLWVFGLAAVLLLIASFWFRFALRFYTSASS